MKVCLLCPNPAVQGRSRCHIHGPAAIRERSPEYDSVYQDLRVRVLKDATVCHICGGGPRPNDPFQADHLIPHSMGGKTELANLRPAHRSCNVRKGGANRRGRGLQKS